MARSLVSSSPGNWSKKSGVETGPTDVRPSENGMIQIHALPRGGCRSNAILVRALGTAITLHVREQAMRGGKCDGTSRSRSRGSTRRSRSRRARNGCGAPRAALLVLERELGSVREVRRDDGASPLDRHAIFSTVFAIVWSKSARGTCHVHVTLRELLVEVEVAPLAAPPEQCTVLDLVVACFRSSSSPASSRMSMQ